MKLIFYSFILTGLLAGFQSNAQCDAGDLTTGQGTMITDSAGGGDLDFKVENDGAPSGGQYAYVITSDAGDILGFPPSDWISISGAPVGTCRVYGVSYEGVLDSSAATIGTLTSDAGCYEVSSNWITVTRTEPTVEGGMVYTDDMKDAVRACQGDNELTFGVNNGSRSSAAYAYVITSNTGMILGLPMGDVIDISGAPVGECYIYGFSYTGLLDSAATMIGNLTSDDEYELSSNWITVNRDEVEAGELNVIGGTDAITASAGEGTLTFEVEHDAAMIPNTEYAFIITSDAGDILGWPMSNEIDISGAPVGVCRVYGVSYTGALDLEAMTIGEVTSDGCFELSSNWITVTRTEPTVEGGMVYTDDMKDAVRACQGDNELTFGVNNGSRSSAAYAYVITSNTGMILGLPMGDVIDISGAPVGECYVYGFSYTGLLDSTAVMIGDLTSDDEYELSSNWITVNRDEVAAGEVNVIGGTDAITASAGEGTLTFEVEHDAGMIPNTEYAFIITSDAGDILGWPMSNEIDISGAPVGVCRVYGVSYTGELDLEAMTIGEVTSDGCYEVSSNWITVTRTEPTVEGGMVYTDDMKDAVRACQGDNELTFGVNNGSRSSAAYAYVITSKTGMILGLPMGDVIDISGAPVGECYVYGFSYTGLLDSAATMIGNLTSDDEYELSSNWVTVNRDEVAAGEVNIEGGATEITAEEGDASLAFTVENDAVSTGSYGYIITSDAGDILGWPMSNSIDISGAPVGVCRVYGISYTGELDSSATTIWDLESDGCFELSMNWITVTRTTVTGIFETAADQGLKLFPTMAEDRITVDASDIQDIIISDANGVDVLHSTSNVINVQDLSSGTYVVKVIHNDSMEVGRFVKQ